LVLTAGEETVTVGRPFADCVGDGVGVLVGVGALGLVVGVKLGVGVLVGVVWAGIVGAVEP
jgi:hypothetical protein